MCVSESGFVDFFVVFFRQLNKNQVKPSYILIHWHGELFIDGPYQTMVVNDHGGLDCYG